MKATYFIPFLAAMLSTLFTNGAPDDKCRLAFEASIPYGSEAGRIEKDLLEGIWIDQIGGSKNTGMKQLLQFNDFGLLDVVTVYSNGHTQYETQQWHLESLGQHVYLVVFDNTLNEELVYEVKQTCEGLQLKDIDLQESKHLKYTPAKSAKELERLRATITGHWSHNGYPFDIANNLEDCGTFVEMNGAFLEYQFNEDGTYQRKMGSHMVDIEEEGFWEITHDGQYLVFHLTRDGSPEQVYSSQYVRLTEVNSLEQHLSFEQVLGVSELNSLFCTRMKSFKFYKTESTPSF